jgi:hypothetical protein
MSNVFDARKGSQAHTSSRLFVLDLAEGRVFSVYPDGSDKKIIATGGRLPDGVAVDVEAGHPLLDEHGLARPQRRLDRRTVLWLMSLGIFDKEYAHATAGSSDEHELVAPDLFTAETPLGMYQGMTDQAVMSRTTPSFRTVLVPRGSSKPEWLPQ